MSGVTDKDIKLAERLRKIEQLQGLVDLYERRFEADRPFAEFGREISQLVAGQYSPTLSVDVLKSLQEKHGIDGG